VATTYQYLANYINEAVGAWRQWAWTGPMFWYSYRDAGTDTNDPEQIFGLVKRDFTPKAPAVATFASAVRG